MAIDLGTANIRIFLPEQGIVLDEPSLIVVEKGGRKRVIAAGDEVWPLLAPRPDSIETNRTLRHGAIIDTDITAQMLRHLIRKVREKHKVRPGPEIIISVPAAASKVQRGALRQAASEIGAGKLWLIEAPMAAAIGADMPVTDPIGSLVVDLGAGKSEVALLSARGLAHVGRIDVGGDAMDDAIFKRIRSRHNLEIDRMTAEAIKNQVGTATWSSDQENNHVHIMGIDAVNGVPKEISISHEQVREALSESVGSIREIVRLALEKLPPEHARQVIYQGIILTGGVAGLQKLDEALSDETGLPVSIADKPLTCVIRGMGRILEGRAPRTFLFPT